MQGNDQCYRAKMRVFAFNFLKILCYSRFLPMNKKNLSEADIKEKFITPAMIKAGWDESTQIGREIYFTDGRIYVKGKIITR